MPPPLDTVAEDLRDALRTMKGAFFVHIQSFLFRLSMLAERRENIGDLCCIHRVARPDFRANITELSLVIDRLMILSESNQVRASNLRILKRFRHFETFLSPPDIGFRRRRKRERSSVEMEDLSSFWTFEGPEDVNRLVRQ